VLYQQLDAPAVADYENRIGLRQECLIARRAAGYAGHNQSANVILSAPPQREVDLTSRHRPFDEQSVDDGCVRAQGIGWQANSARTADHCDMSPSSVRKPCADRYSIQRRQAPQSLGMYTVTTGLVRGAIGSTTAAVTKNAVDRAVAASRDTRRASRCLRDKRRAAPRQRFTTVHGTGHGESARVAPTLLPAQNSALAPM
jgi:hypothetical protein